MSKIIEMKLQEILANKIPIDQFMLCYDDLSEFHRTGTTFILHGLKVEIIGQQFHGKTKASGVLSEDSVKEIVQLLLKLRPWAETNTDPHKMFAPDSTFVSLTIRVESEQISLSRLYDEAGSILEIRKLLQKLSGKLTETKEDRSDLTKSFICHACKKTLQIPTDIKLHCDKVENELGKSINYKIELDLSEYCAGCKVRWKDVPIEKVAENREFATENIVLGIATINGKHRYRIKTSYVNVPMLVQMLNHEFDVIYLDPKSDDLQYVSGKFGGAIADKPLRKWYRKFRKEIEQKI